MRRLLKPYLVGLSESDRNLVNGFLDTFEKTKQIESIIQINCGDLVEFYVCDKKIRKHNKIYERYRPTFSILKRNGIDVLVDKPIHFDFVFKPVKVVNKEV